MNYGKLLIWKMNDTIIIRRNNKDFKLTENMSKMSHVCENVHHILKTTILMFTM